MKIITKNIDDLKPAPYNPRIALKQGDSEYEKIKNSLLTFDYIEPIVWNESTGNVVSGNQRLSVLKDLGYKKVEVSVISLPLERERKSLILL